MTIKNPKIMKIVNIHTKLKIKFFINLGDNGLVLKTKAKHAAISAKLRKPLQKSLFLISNFYNLKS